VGEEEAVIFGFDGDPRAFFDRGSDFAGGGGGC